MLFGGEVSAWLTGDITQDRAPEIRQPTTPLPMQDRSINSSNNTPTNAGSCAWSSNNTPTNAG
jgi:hypothetical protein